VLLIVLPQVLVTAYVEVEYGNIINTYKAMYSSYLDREGLLNATWKITKTYEEEMFQPTYGTPTILLSDVAILFVPTLTIYSLSGGLNKIIVVQKAGRCSEFATAITTLLKDITSIETRKVYFEGVDHALPEVYLNGEWWVFDATYTTPKYPVRAVNYASHLKPKIRKCVARIIEESTNLNVLSEHGFNASTLSITAIIDLTTNPYDDVPASDATVEIYAPENLYDPLVATGKTDGNGNFTVQLNGDKQYVILIKSCYMGRSVIGIAVIYLPPSTHETIEIKLHKYG